MTFDLIPTDGVATEPPRAATGTLKVIPGSVSVSYTHLTLPTTPYV